MVQSTAEYPKEVAVDLLEKVPIQVLHVDDEADFLKAAKQILEMQGAFHVDTASSIEEALERMKQKPYDVIVSDYIMSGKDGLEFVKELRDNGNNIPFIIFTGRGREIVAIRALNLGADLYVSKIGDPETVYSELAHGIIKLVKAKRAEETLYESEERFRMLSEGAFEAVAIHDKGKILEVNQAFVKMFGYERSEVVGMNALELAAPESRDSVLRNILSGYEKPYEAVGLRKDGSTFVGELCGKPIPYKGRMVRVTAMRDITERKRMEEALRKSEEEYRSIVEMSPDSIITVDTKGLITSCNAAATKMLGFPEDEIVGKHFSKIGVIRVRDLAKFQKLFSSVIKGGLTKPLELTFSCKDGTPLLAEVRVGLLKEGGKTIGVQAISRDITKRNEAEEDFRKLFNSMADPVVIVDGKGKFLEINDRAVEVIGYEKEEFIGKNFIRTGITTAKSKVILVKNLAKRMMGMHLAPYEVEGVTKNGRTIPFEVNAIRIEYKGKPADLVIFRDITERKKMQEKLRIVGKLTRHDVRNKLSTVSMNVFLVKRKLAGDHEALEQLSQIESACGQAGRIFDFAGIYEQLGAEELAYMDVEKTVEEASTLFSDLQGVRVLNDCHGLTVLADSLLRQLFYNLIDNSLRHGKKVGQIRVHYEVAEKDQLNLVYEDDGVGIPTAAKKKLFTEGYGKGTGYGLYLIRKMCDVYGWAIRETGKPGKGVQFTITIPKMCEKGKTHYKLHHPLVAESKNEEAYMPPVEKVKHFPVP